MPSSFEFTPGAVASTGRVALVLGGGSGTGAVVVRALAARGWSVAIHAHGSFAAAREAAARLQDAGLPALAVTADLRDEGPVRTLVHRVIDHFGRLDALVACTGVRGTTPLADLAADDLRGAIDVAGIGVLVAAHEAAVVTDGQDRDLAIVLVGATVDPQPGVAARILAAGATTAVARALEAEFAARRPRPRVNVLEPAAAAAADRVAHAVLFLLENDAVAGVRLPVTPITGPPPPAGGS